MTGVELLAELYNIGCRLPSEPSPENGQDFESQRCVADEESSDVGGQLGAHGQDHEGIHASADEASAAGVTADRLQDSPAVVGRRQPEGLGCGEAATSAGYRGGQGGKCYGPVLKRGLGGKCLAGRPKTIGRGGK